MPRFNPEDLPAGSMQRQQLEAALAETPVKHSGKIKQRPEEVLQKAIMKQAREWPMLDLLGPTWPDIVRKAFLGSWIYHVPNQRAEMLHRKFLHSMGVMAGVWDLVVYVPVQHRSGRIYAGLYQECKASNNDHLTDNQAVFGERAAAVGYKTQEVRSTAVWAGSIEDYFYQSKPLAGLPYE